MYKPFPENKPEPKTERELFLIRMSSADYDLFYYNEEIWNSWGVTDFAPIPKTKEDQNNEVCQ